MGKRKQRHQHRRKQPRQLTTADFVRISTKVHNGKYNYDKSTYTRGKAYITITCPVHGDFEQIARSHMVGEGCSKCKHNGRSWFSIRTQEQLIDAANAKYNYFFSYNKTVYTGRGKYKIIVTCPLHGDFQVSVYQHLYGKSGCGGCHAESGGKDWSMSTEEFVSRGRAVHGDKFDYSKTTYISRFDEVTIGCRVHGFFQQNPTSHLAGHGCKQCSVDESSARYRSNTQSFTDKANVIHGGIYDYSKVEYGKNGDQNVTIICKTHGEFQQTPHSHLRGAGCLKCYRATVGHHRRLTNEEFIAKIQAIHGDKYLYHKVRYVNTRTKVELVCPKHGSFWVKANGIIANHQGCPKCNYSKGENTIKRVLRRMEVEFVDQYRIPNCQARFRYDFYLPRLKLFIEFQGEQHFKPMGYNGGEENLLDTQRRDRLKYDLALSLGYRIVYFDYKQFRLPTHEFEALVVSTLSNFKPTSNRRKQHGTH